MNLTHRIPHQPVALLLGIVGLIVGLVSGRSQAAEPLTPARVAVYFSPRGGATDAVVREITAAKTQILLQAYSFTSAPIAKALVDAHKRGVQILAVLDKSNQTEKYSAATFLVHAGIKTLIDDQHAIAHNKVMVIDAGTIITGSFNFTKNAEENNAENLLMLKEAPELVQAYTDNINAHVAHAHPYTPRQASATPTGASQTVDAGGAVHGNKNSKVYHLPRCPGYTTLSPASVVAFATENAARQAGYRKAKNCP